MVVVITKDNMNGEELSFAYSWDSRRCSFSVNCKQVRLVNENKVAFLDGKGLCVWDLHTDERKYTWSNTNGFSTFAVNFRRDLIAVAEYSLRPEIYLFDSDLNLIHTFESSIT